MVLKRICGVILLAVSLPCAGAGQQATSDPNGLADASLEELMNIEVTSVSKKSQRLSSTAASAFVITAEDIRRSGLIELPEILRLAPGVQVARLESGRWAVSIRGFTNDFSNKLMVLVDGRSVYSEVQPGVLWDMVHVPVDSIERIEVIRGPGAALWGENAVNGVINIITKSAKDTQGTLVAAEAGWTEGNGTVRFGGAAGSKAFYRIGGGYDQQAALNGYGIPISAHGWNNSSIDFRMDWNPTAQDSVLVSGQGYHSVIGHNVVNPTADNPSPAAIDTEESSFSGNVLVRWQHIISEKSSVEGRVSWERMNYGDVYVPQRTQGVDLQFQHRVTAGKHNDLVWGLEYKRATANIPDTLADRVLPAHSERDLTALFVEDQMTLVPDRLQFIAGVRIGYQTAFGVQVQPTGRVLWTPTAKLATWAAVSRAIHIPTVVEAGFQASLAGVPSQSPLVGPVQISTAPNIRPETTLSYEAGQRFQIGRRISLEVSAFYTVYQHLIAAEILASDLVPPSGSQGPTLAPPGPANARYGASEGEDLSATWSASRRWKLTGGYSWLRIHTHTYPGLAANDAVTDGGSSPHDQYQLRSSLSLTRTLELDTALYYTSKLPEESVPGHLREDIRIGWRHWEHLELSVGVQDAFQPQHPELPSQRLNGLAEVHRNFYGRAIWRF